MRTEKWLDQLGSIARDENDAWLEDPRLERLVRGELSPEDLADLRAEAPGSRDLALAIELMSPRPRDAEQRVIERVVGPLPARPSRVRIPAWVRAAAAACVCGVGAMMATRAPAIPMLVATVAVTSVRGEADATTDDAGPLQLFDGANFHMDIEVPALQGAIEARAFLLGEGEARPWAAPLTRPDDRRVTLDGQAEVLFKGVPRGRWEVVIAVGRAAALPDDADDLKELLAEDPGGDEPVRFVRQTIVLETEDETTLADAEALRHEPLTRARARDLLLPLLDSKTLSTRARATGKLARIAAKTQKTDAELDVAVGLFRAAIALDRQGRLVSDEHQDTYALSYTLAVRGRFEEARAALAELPASTAEFPEAVAQNAYYRGVVGKEAGELGAALSSFESAAAEGAALGLIGLVLDATTVQVSLLLAMGRDKEAEALMPVLEAVLESEKDPCKHAGLLGNIGAFWLVLKTDAWEPTERRLQEAVDAHRDTCGEARPFANALASLAEAKLRAGDAEDARRAVAQGRSALRDAGPVLGAEWDRIEGEALLALGRPEEALGVFERLAGDGAERIMPDAEWTAAVGRARAFDKLGRFDDAARAYAEASALVARRAIAVPLGQGRDAFSSKLAKAGQSEVAFLLRHERYEQAASAARRSRARALALLRWSDRIDALGDVDKRRWSQAVTKYRRSVEQLETGARGHEQRLAADVRSSIERALAIVGSSSRDTSGDAPLDEPAIDEVFLVYHEVPGGWAGFAVTPRGAVAALLDPIDVAATPEALAPILFGPFGHELEQASRVRIMASGAIGALDLHAFPWKGEPLVATHAVAYGLDVGKPAVGRAVEGGESLRAVVVGDPSSNLGAARDEAEIVEATLGWQGVDARLIASDDATLDAVRGAIEMTGTTLFHYAGHGLVGGRDGSQSRLPLAAGRWLGIGDILMLSHVPRMVVLSGCDTGSATGALNLGLAQAFVVAGADSVVATTRPVKDNVARQVMEALYSAARAPGTADADAAAALQEATLSVMDAGSGADWASFRVIVP